MISSTRRVEKHRRELNCKAFAAKVHAFRYDSPKSMASIPHMKKLFALSVLTSVAMICACQKRDSTAQQQQLTEQTTELGARQEALAKKLNSLDEKVNSLNQRGKKRAKKEPTTMPARPSPADIQSQTIDPAQIEA